jgi:hypothetical protein
LQQHHAKSEEEGKESAARGETDVSSASRPSFLFARADAHFCLREPARKERKATAIAILPLVMSAGLGVLHQWPD